MALTGGRQARSLPLPQGLSVTATTKTALVNHTRPCCPASLTFAAAWPKVRDWMPWHGQQCHSGSATALPSPTYDTIVSDTASNLQLMQLGSVVTLTVQ